MGDNRRGKSDTCVLADPISRDEKTGDKDGGDISNKRGGASQKGAELARSTRDLRAASACGRAPAGLRIHHRTIRVLRLIRLLEIERSVRER